MKDPELEAKVRLSPALVPLKPGARLDIEGARYKVGDSYIENDLDSPHYAGRLYSLTRQDSKKFGLQISHTRSHNTVVLIQLVEYHGSYPANEYVVKGSKPVTIDGITYRPDFSSTQPYRTEGGRRGQKGYIMFTKKDNFRHPRLTLEQYDNGRWRLITKRDLHITAVKVL